MILDASRRTDNNMRSMSQGRLLRAKWLTTTQQNQLDIGRAAGQPAEFFSYLVGQLPGWAQHQCLDTKKLRIDLMQQADAKSRCFTTTRFCLGNQIPAFNT